LERRFARFFWADPRVILDPDITRDPGISSPGRCPRCASGVRSRSPAGTDTPVADQMLIDNVDLSDATIVDIGAADGSTSVDLI